MQDSNGQMRRGSEAKQPDPLSMLHASYAETAKTNDAGAQKRGSVQIVQPAGQRKNKISPGNRILRIPAVHGVAGESGRVAKVLQAVPAIPARPIDAADPGNPNPGP